MSRSVSQLIEPQLFAFVRWLEREDLGLRSDYPGLTSHHDEWPPGRPQAGSRRRRR